MARSFAITTSTPSVRLDGAGRGETTFTVTNALGRPVRGRALVEPEGTARAEWLTLVGEAERDFASDGTHQYTVRVAVPPGTPEGTYAFHLSEVSVENPDEEFTTGPSVGFQVARAAAPVRKKRFPFWALALAAGIVFITLTAVLVARGHRNEQGIGGSGSAEPRVALGFDGRSTYVELGNPSALDFTGPVTLEAWIRPTALDGLRNIVAHGYILSPPQELFFRIINGTYQVGSWDGVDHSVSVTIPGSDLGQWVHLAGVYDGSRWILYRDGQEVASVPQPIGVIHVDAPWAIGARGGGTERFFQGDIRDVRIWSVPRGPEQIKEDMRRAPKAKEQGLVGYWPLDEAMGDQVRDLSPSQRHGLVHNGQWESAPTRQ